MLPKDMCKHITLKYSQNVIKCNQVIYRSIPVYVLRQTRNVPRLVLSFYACIYYCFHHVLFSLHFFFTRKDSYKAVVELWKYFDISLLNTWVNINSCWQMWFFMTDKGQSTFFVASGFIRMQLFTFN